MNSAISTYLRTDPSFKTVSDVVGSMARVLDSETSIRLSPSLLEAFLVGESSVIRFVSESKYPKSVEVMTLLYRLVQRSLLTTKSLSSVQIEKLFSYILNALENNVDKKFWQTTADLLTSEFGGALITCAPMLEKFRNFFVRFFSDTTSSKNDLGLVAQFMSMGLLDRAVAMFTANPSYDYLRAVLRLTSIGFMICKFFPSECVITMNRLVRSLHTVATNTYVETLCGKDEHMQIEHEFPFTKLLELLQSLMDQAPCHVLGILDSLVVLFPRVTSDQSNFQLIVQLLMHSIRLPAVHAVVDSVEDKENASVVHPAIAAMRVLVRLVDTWFRSPLSEEQHVHFICQLFDVLRVFPGSVAHAECRLQTWWHFVCRLPSSLLQDGFRRFVSPFLANLLGRYLSISTPMGDPQLHRYKLSNANAYDGNHQALRLTQHVFACFFQGAPSLSLDFCDSVPKLTADKTLLATNSYQLLVALVHWLHLVCGNLETRSVWPPGCLPTPTVDTIWTSCVVFMLQSAADVNHQSAEENARPPPQIRSPSIGSKTAPQSLLLQVAQHVVRATTYLVSSPPKATTLAVGCPRPDRSLNILAAVGDAIWKLSIPDQDKVELLFDLLLKLLELGAGWIRREGLPQDFTAESLETCLNDWVELALRWIGLDPRLQVAFTGSTDGPSRAQFLPLLRQVLLALVPESVHLAASRTISDTVSQDSSLSLFLGQTPVTVYSPQALQILAQLLERLTRFILVTHSVCEGDSLVRPDFTTVEAMHIAPFWFAGPTMPLGLPVASDAGLPESSVYLCNMDEVALASRLCTLFMTFHQEACLLTTVATNAWIGQLGQKLTALLSAFTTDPSKHINFNLLGRLLRAFAQNAERVHESGSSDAPFNPFHWRATPEEEPFGQLTGLLHALKHCLQHFPWPYPALPAKQLPSSSPSPTVRTSQDTTDRVLLSPPMLPFATEPSEASCVDYSDASSQSRPSLIDRVSSASYKVSYGLIDALEAVVILLSHHSTSPEQLDYFISTLSPTFSHLVNCCARADVESAEVDEPLFITQRRHQAKLALEEIFITIWRSLGCSAAASFTAADSEDLIHSLHSQPCRIPSHSPVPLAPHQCGTLLHAALTLSRICAGPSAARHSNFPRFLQWFVGFWNRLVDTCLHATAKSSTASQWAPICASLRENETVLRNALGLRAKPSSPHVTPVRGRGRRAGKVGGGSDRVSKERGKRQTRNPATEETPGSTGSPNQVAIINKRSKRGRLSLSKVATATDQTGSGTPTTEVPTTHRSSLPLSAPPAVSSNRGRRSLLFSASPDRHSSGILATALGIRKGINLLACDSSWSPTQGSPDRLPRKPLVKRRLFLGDDDNEKVEPTADSSGVNNRTKESIARPQTEKLRTLPPPVAADFEDSAQFVFIPPAPDNVPKRRRSLTAHQKEKFHEQRLGYIPTTYTELDNSQQSISDSQSESQSQFSQHSVVAPRDSTQQRDLTTSQPESAATDPIQSNLATPLAPLTSVNVVGESVEFEDLVMDTPDEENLQTMSGAILPEPSADPLPEPLPTAGGPKDVSPSLSDESGADEVVSDGQQQQAGVTKTGEQTDASHDTAAAPLPADPPISVPGSVQSPTNAPPLPLHLRLKAACSPSSPALPAPSVLNLSSPLVRAGNPTRAQRMLVLGLQKAAEQSARHKAAASSLSDSPAEPPSTPEPEKQTVRIKRPDSESPPSILRGIASKKTVRRVSFAEKPTVFTFGEFQSSSSDSSPPTPPFETLVRRHNSTLFSDEFHSPSLYPVELNSSQASIDPLVQSPPEGSSPVSSAHRRKSSSPQRRSIAPKVMAAVGRSMIAMRPVTNSTMMTTTTATVPPFRKRRRLYSDESPDKQVQTSAAVHDEVPVEPSAAAVVVAVVPDSETMEITDTQESQNVAAPLPDHNEYGLVVESSQGTQEPTVEGGSSNVELASMNSPPMLALHSQSEATRSSIAVGTDDLDQQPVVCEVEAYIMDALASVQSKLASLPIDRHQPILMHMLNTFKPLMK